MDRIRKTLVLLSVIALPAAAHSTLTAPETLCFASGGATYRISHTAPAPDYRVRIDNATARPDLRMTLVDRPEIADFVLADDYGPAESTACRSSVPVKTVKLDAEAAAPDVTISLTADGATPDYRIYVHSVRFSHQDTAALLAVTWKAAQNRRLADAR
jgi:hypothetical protein